MICYHGGILPDRIIRNQEFMNTDEGQRTFWQKIAVTAGIVLFAIMIIASLGNREDASAALIVNTNVASLQAQKELVEAQKALSESFARISEGLATNTASDDAAGLGISEDDRAEISEERALLGTLSKSLSAVSAALKASDDLEQGVALLEQRAAAFAEKPSAGNRTAVNKGITDVRKSEKLLLAAIMGVGKPGLVSDITDVRDSLSTERDAAQKIIKLSSDFTRYKQKRSPEEVKLFLTALHTAIEEAHVAQNDIINYASDMSDYADAEAKNAQDRW